MSVAQAEPEHEAPLHGGHGQADRQELPAPPMVVVEVVGEEGRREGSAGDTADTGRPQAVNEETLVDHRFFSSVKITSTGTEKVRAKSRASGRLGTYRCRSMELMLWRETPTASASSCCVHPCSS